MRGQMQAVINFSCPACGAEGYDITFNADEIGNGVQIEIHCDDCRARISVDCDVHVQAVAQPLSTSGTDTDMQATPCALGAEE